MPKTALVAALRDDHSTNRLTWIVELMSRYATEKADSHDCPRLSAAIVSHLKALLDELPTQGQLADTVSHWLDTWEPLMERHVTAPRTVGIPPAMDASTSLSALVTRARYAQSP